MNSLVAKEIRLLLPAFGTALLLAILPVWLLPLEDGGEMSLNAFGLGVVLLGLSAFGREVGLGTFPLLLAQPMERQRLWRTKVAVLAVAMLSVLGAWCLSRASCVEPSLGDTSWLQTVALGATVTGVALAGGLWTTLLLRQMVEAFWITLLAPLGILGIVWACGGSTHAMLAAMAIYSVAGVMFARRQFFQAQDATWSGGMLMMPGLPLLADRWRASNRHYKPWSALFGKELRLLGVGLAGMGWLFVMHVAVILLRRAAQDRITDELRTVLELFGGLWIIAPVLLACLSVAEERKLGVTDLPLCLPISRRVQFVTKLLMVLILGGILSAVLSWAAEKMGHALGVKGVGIPPLALSVTAFAVLTLVGFYASTLSRSIVQALGAAVVIVLFLCALLGVITSSWVRLHNLWDGMLVFYIGWPTLAAVSIWLGYRNFRWMSEGRRHWVSNGLWLAATLAGITLMTSALYHRAWELLMPIEPVHGPTRLSGPKAVSLHTYGGNGLAVLEEGGRLWAGRVGYNPGHAWLTLDGSLPGFRVDGRWTNLGGPPAVEGTNWVAAVATFRETVAIRTDGTLWVSARPRRGWGEAMPLPEPAAGMVQFGAGTNWQSVVLEYVPWSVLLLRRDGTLWRLGVTSFSEKKEWPGLRAHELQRLTSESDWARILAAPGGPYAWKQDGSAWAVEMNQNDDSETGARARRVRGLDHVHLRSLASYMGWQVGVREDGTLWAWRRERSKKTLSPDGSKESQGRSEAPMRIGTDADWVGVGGGFSTLAGLKSDGSLWRWQWDSWNPEIEPAELIAQRPVRLSKQSVWVGVGSVAGGIVSLSSDGALWYWWRRGGDSWDPRLGMLSASRKPVRILSLFDD